MSRTTSAAMDSVKDLARLVGGVLFVIAIMVAAASDSATVQWLAVAFIALVVYCAGKFMKATER